MKGEVIKDLKILPSLWTPLTLCLWDIEIKRVKHDKSKFTWTMTTTTNGYPQSISSYRSHWGEKATKQYVVNFLEKNGFKYWELIEE